MYRWTNAVSSGHCRHLAWALRSAMAQQMMFPSLSHEWRVWNGRLFTRRIRGAETRDLASSSRSSEAAHRAVCLLETLRGAARGASGTALRPTYAALQAVQARP